MPPKIGGFFLGCNMTIKLKDYQIDGVKYFLKSKYGCLISLKAGSGKSVLLYKIMKLIKGKILLVSFKYVLEQHKINITSLLPDFDIVHITKSKQKIDIKSLSENTVFLISPQIFSKYETTLSFIKFDLLCVDESHLMKNPNSKRTLALIKFSSEQLCKKILLSATPCPEEVDDLQPQMEFLSKDIIGDKNTFKNKYIRSGFKNGVYFKSIKFKDTITRMCSEHIFSVPDSKIPMLYQPTETMWLEMPTKLRNLYEEFKETCRVLIHHPNPETLDEEIREIICTHQPNFKLHQIACGIIIDNQLSFLLGKSVGYTLCDFKAKYIKSTFSDFDGKIIVWANFRKELEMLRDILPKSELIYGGTKNGAEIIQRFKNNKFKYLIAHPASLGTGLSFDDVPLQIATSFSHSGCMYTQTCARTNRLGQKKPSKRVELLYKDSIQSVIKKAVSLKNKKESYRLEYISKKVFG